MSVQMKPLLLAAIVAVFVAKLAQCAETPLTIAISLTDGSVEKAGSPVECDKCRCRRPKTTFVAPLLQLN